MEKFAACFAELEDPREANARHDLLEILMIGLCTMLCGGEDCSDMAVFGRAKATFLRQFLRLRHGIPSHDTFSRVFRLLDPAQFQACFLHFMQDFAATAQGVIAIDGKTTRRSFDAISSSPSSGAKSSVFSSPRCAPRACRTPTSCRRRPAVTLAATGRATPRCCAA